MSVMRHVLTVVMILSGSITGGVAADWGKVKADYETTRQALEQATPPRYHVSVAGERAWLFDARPELGMNIHRIDLPTLQALKKVGVKMVRFTVYWYHFQPANKPWGEYAPEAVAGLEQSLTLLASEGMTPLVVVHGNAKGVSFATRQDGYQRFAEFMAFLAKRYPTVRYWQLWNEMDESFTDLFGAKDPAIGREQRGRYYAEMLRLAYPEIKQANPKALVVTGGMVDYQGFPVGLYEAGGRDFFDILALHTYGAPLAWSYVGRGAKVRKIMQRYGDGEKPLWNTEFGVSCNTYITAWGVPKRDPGEAFDRQQKEALEDCVTFNRRAALYDKSFIYAYAATAELDKKKQEQLQPQLPEGRSAEDYGYGLTRKDGVTPRPALERICELAANSGLEKPAAVTYGFRVDAQEIKGSAELSSAEPVEVAVPRSQRLRIEGGELRRGGEPFFPLGFVFGRTDAELSRAKEVGMNSVHQEYSIRDLWPDNPETISQEGLERIRALHELCRRNGMMYFPLLSGHYIPGWLNKQAAGAPKDVDGKKIGLWFHFSIHDLVYRTLLEKFWTAVAKEVGDDCNAGAFVSWNEPAYGLDATPPAQAAFRAWAQRRYATIDAFNKEAQTSFAEFSAITPPAKPEDNRAYWYLWVSYNRQTFADFFAWQRGIFKAQAPLANLSGKHPITATTGDALYCNDAVLQAQTQDIYGCDLYNGSLLHYRNAFEAARSLNPYGPVISYETHAQKALPPLKPRQASLQLFAQILGGCKGLFFFASGNVKGFGFDNEEATPPAVREELTRFFQLVSRNPRIFAAPRQPAQIAVILSTPSTIHYGTVADTRGRDDYALRLNQTYDLLRNQHYAVDFLNDTQLKEKAGQYQLLVVPSLTILDDDALKQLEQFCRRGGRLLCFGESFARDPWFRESAPPAFLGLKKRAPSPWNRGQMRIVEVVPELAQGLRGELTVMRPEIVNPASMEELLPGYTPKVTGSGGWLAANQDAYASILLSSDRQSVYCAFDSLYSDGLSRLLGCLVRETFRLQPELSIRRAGEDAEATEILSAIYARPGEQYLLLANGSPQAVKLEIRPSNAAYDTVRDLMTQQKIVRKDGVLSLTMEPLSYRVLIAEGTR